MQLTPGEPMELASDSPIRQAALEIEAHVAEGGWDQPPRLYSLVRTAEIIENEPTMARDLGLDVDGAAESYTPVEQDELPLERSFEDLLRTIEWPPQVAGCAAVVERVMLPPDAESALPEDPDAVATYAAEHPDRQEVRIVAAVARDGSVHCAIREYGHDGAEALLEGPDLVPGLVELLSHTLSE